MGLANDSHVLRVRMALRLGSPSRHGACRNGGARHSARKNAKLVCRVGYIDFVRHSVASLAAQDMVSGRDHWQTRPVVWLALGGETKFFGVRLGLQVSVTVQLTKVHYDLVEGDQRTALYNAVDGPTRRSVAVGFLSRN